MSYTEIIARLLEMTPAGITNDQLLWRLRRAGLRLASEEIIETLGTLAESGVAQVRSGGRWQLAQFHTRATSASPDVQQPSDPARQRTLTAIAGHLYPARQFDGGIGQDQDASAPPADADCRKLLAYYASTQRLDPRGSVDEREDRHGEAWQLFSVDGRWWDRSELRFNVDRLPSSFRQALSRREGQACAIGYP